MWKDDLKKIKVPKHRPRKQSKVLAELYANNPFYKELIDKRDKQIKPKKKVKKKKHPLKYLFKKSYNEFLNSEYWAKVRNKVLERDKFTCVCGSNINLHVHHKTYKNHFNEHLHLEDLITLCNICHKKEHNIK